MAALQRLWNLVPGERRADLVFRRLRADAQKGRVDKLLPPAAVQVCPAQPMRGGIAPDELNGPFLIARGGRHRPPDFPTVPAVFECKIARQRHTARRVAGPE
jgi:hypothetical protein